MYDVLDTQVRTSNPGIVGINLQCTVHYAVDNYRVFLISPLNNTQLIFQLTITKTYLYRKMTS